MTLFYFSRCSPTLPILLVIVLVGGFNSIGCPLGCVIIAFFQIKDLFPVVFCASLNTGISVAFLKFKPLRGAFRFARTKSIQYGSIGGGCNLNLYIDYCICINIQLEISKMALKRSQSRKKRTQRL